MEGRRTSPSPRSRRLRRERRLASAQAFFPGKQARQCAARRVRDYVYGPATQDRAASNIVRVTFLTKNFWRDLRAARPHRLLKFDYDDFVSLNGLAIFANCLEASHPMKRSRRRNVVSRLRENAFFPPKEFCNFWLSLGFSQNRACPALEHHARRFLGSDCWGRRDPAQSDRLNSIMFP